MDYVQENALTACVFESLQAENAFLSQGESSTADTRLRGTTRHQVGKPFRQLEHPALLLAVRRVARMARAAQ